jgi:hypothetical protein
MNNVVEAILHFAGYMHVGEETTLSHVFYDGGWHAGVKISDMSSHTRSAHSSVGELDSISSFESSVSQGADSSARHSVKLPIIVKPDAHHAPLQHAHASHISLHGSQGDTLPTSSFEVGQQHHYSISYGVGGDQTVINVNQLNIEFNNNTLASNLPWEGVNGGQIAALNGMVHQGLDQIPQNLALPDSATTSLPDFIKAHDDAWARTGSDGHDAPVADGRYHNGAAELVDPSTDSPSTPSLPVQTDSHPLGQIAELGGNTATNAATVIDANETASTKIVLGNLFQTNAIVQTNVLNDQSSVDHSGAQPAQIADGHDHTDNIASLTDKSGPAAPNVESADGLSVHVDTLNGDFFNVHAVSQTNWLSNGNIMVQTEYQAYSKVIAGDSDQQNSADVLTYGHHYDLVIVGGDYHEANLIYQTNVILNQNNVFMGGTGQNDGAASDQSINVGNNQLKNEASIEHDGTQKIGGVTDNVSTLVHELEQGGQVEESLIAGLSGDTQGSLNVLLVTGNYYDLNIVSQMNVISNINLAGQQTGDVGQGFQQFVSAGGNIATNTAQITATGSSNQEMVGGGHYSDSLLIQANLVQSNHDPIIHSNTDALVNEAIAFIGGSDGHQPSDNMASALSAAQDYNHHQDLLGQVMA